MPTGLAVEAVDGAAPRAGIQGFSTEGMSLEQVALLRHESNQDQNRDPEVEELLKGAVHGGPKSEVPRTSDAYEGTGPMKRSFDNRFPPRATPAKKVKLEGAADPSSKALPSRSKPAYTPREHTKSQAKVKRDARRRELQLQSRARKAEELKSKGGLDALTFRTSSTGWQGTNYGSTKEGKELIAQWEDYSILLRLKDFDRVPYCGLKTRIRDSQGRLWLVRTFVGERIEALLPAFEKQAAAFVSTVETNRSGFTEAEMEENSRGSHWSSICGHDRNSKQVPTLAAWHSSNAEAVDALWRPDGAMFQIRQALHSVPLPEPHTSSSAIMNRVFRAEFPLLAKRYADCSQALGISPLYGHFFSFCLNSARAGVERVHCSPHVDWKNIAIGVCVVFVYGKFNSKERSWLVIWEAGLILEMPAGVFVMYPSSLFFHFNVDVCDLKLVCTDGRPPTPENSSLLDGGNGRGSCVWFNQSSMFQTAELGFATIAQAREAGVPCNSDSSSLISRGFFPLA
ncbi:uncharacterized protein F5891DRAFT_1196730 [Suillus fuscotomentosus]|uniref:Uncharacterized protein n=1 Tax=Suillus fuscotomentosus TaxID=1912939 RepID=A0AAD4DSN6_9AGAM|nr:uncharacterized protein F5891DRAFT_1196730 [Suillus fuscotomentosus]KAG1893200.1 hypothetical protein F5891DRAFT_1196730 [Suillus fuscotomentosus]